jgi:3-oxoacyl-[acyl-carrier protein] reductase
VLNDRVALVTGVSRKPGIGAAIARRLSAVGATVFAAGWEPHDAEMPWGANTVDDIEFASVDLEDPAAPAQLVDAAIDRHGALDIVVATHARSSHGNLAEVTAEELDRCWAVNARASVLLTQAFAARHDDARPGGRVVLFTSGQHLGPMGDEIAYAISKGAIHQMTRSLADQIADRGMTLNTINPGPVDTGWAMRRPGLHEEVARHFPQGRWGTPGDIAKVVAWLVSDDAGWVTGQVLNADGGVR